MAIALRYAARSDLGLLRGGNEDSGYAGPRLLVVADGVGGHAAGEVASSVTVSVLSALDEEAPGGDLLDRLSSAVKSANTYLHDMVQGDPELRGMSTTVTAMLRAGPRFGLVHVGDSRCYLLRGDELQQITHDHTFVQALIDEGRITPEEADHHPQRSVITNALDGAETLDLDLSVREARVGDRYLLCSDGLSGVVSDDTLRETLADTARPEDAVERLVELALRGGGPDNITAIVADVVEVDASPSAVPVVVGAAAATVNRRSEGSSAAAKAAALSPQLDESDGEGDFEGDPAAHHVRRVLLSLLVLAVLATGGYGAWRWSQQQYYVGAQDEKVAIFQGLSQDIGPLEMSKVYAAQDISLSDLPAYQQDRVRSDIAADGLTDARRIVTTLRRQAAVCRDAAARAAASPTESASPSASTSGSATPKPSSSTSTPSSSTTTPSPTPTPANPEDPATSDCLGDGS
jgi:serine/threonine protein phosphatase PrpC